MRLSGQFYCAQHPCKRLARLTLVAQCVHMASPYYIFAQYSPWLYSWNTYALCVTCPIRPVRAYKGSFQVSHFQIPADQRTYRLEYATDYNPLTQENPVFIGNMTELVPKDRPAVRKIVTQCLFVKVHFHTLFPERSQNVVIHSARSQDEPPNTYRQFSADIRRRPA